MYKLFGKGGASLGQVKIYDALKNLVDNNNEYQLSVVSLDAEQFTYKYPNANIKKTRTLDVLSRVFWHSTYFYFNWVKIRKSIFSENFDLVIIGNSKLGFIAKDLKKHSPNTKTVVHFDNIEYDAALSYYADKKNPINSIKRIIDQLVTKNDEKKSIRYSDHLFFLSKRDSNRAKVLYKNQTKYSIWPVTLKQGKPLEIQETKTIVFLGTLSYGSNLKALEWFLEKVWSEINLECKFIIAGNKPTKELINRISGDSQISLYADFNDLADIIPQSSLLIAPVYWGAGMKVKVAEALSYGLHIIGTDEAFVGYDELVLSNSLIKANNPNEFITGISQYLALSITKINENSYNHISQWKKLYCDKTSISILSEFMKEITK